MEIPYTIDDSKKKASLDMQSITDAVKEQSKREKEKQKHQREMILCCLLRLIDV